MPRYKCPDCGGEFDEPAVVHHITEDDGRTTAPTHIVGSPVYKCPFCGRIMVGL